MWISYLRLTIPRRMRLSLSIVPKLPLCDLHLSPATRAAIPRQCLDYPLPHTKFTMDTLCHGESASDVERHRFSSHSGSDFAPNSHPKTRIRQHRKRRCARTHCGRRDVRSSTASVRNVDP